MYIVVESGIEIDRCASREDAEQVIVDLLLAGRWDDLVCRLAEIPVWVERVRL